MSVDPVIRIIQGARQARATLLRRQSLDLYSATPEMSLAIESLFGQPLTPDQAVARILSDVEHDGDAAVLRYTALLDDPAAYTLRVPAERIEQAWENTPPDIQHALEFAAGRIAAFYERQPHQSWMAWDAAWGRSSARWIGWESMPPMEVLPIRLRCSWPPSRREWRA
jgi:histidinol dehydrogenase